MAHGLPGGTSFMEDYTYDFSGTPKILGSHMLEICPSIAAATPALEVHALGIGGKAGPVRPVFSPPNGPAIVASPVDMGKRFRMIVHEIYVIQPEQPLPRLPVASAVWLPRPSLKLPQQLGYTPVVHTTPASAKPSPWSISKTLPRSPASSSSASTPKHASASSVSNSAGKKSLTPEIIESVKLIYCSSLSNPC